MGSDRSIVDLQRETKEFWDNLGYRVIFQKLVIPEYDDMILVLNGTAFRYNVKNDVVRTYITSVMKGKSYKQDLDLPDALIDKWSTSYRDGLYLFKNLSRVAEYYV